MTATPPHSEVTHYCQLPTRPRVIVLANRLKSPVQAATQSLLPWLESRADVVAVPDLTQFDADAAAELPTADLILVLGGDGTMIGQARQTVALDLPVLGVNFGKLGFLAEFSIDDLHTHWDQLVQSHCHATRRVMIETMVFDPDSADCDIDALDMDHCRFVTHGVNDAVITAGPPFRMIELQLTIDPTTDKTRHHDLGTHFTGDGVIVSTATGSTAYNLSAGGPIISPSVDAHCITPICPQSLAFRPLVVAGSSSIALRVLRANAGTTLSIDGQVSIALQRDEQVFIRRSPHTFQLIRNPRVSYWRMLAEKMHWASNPTNPD